MPLEVGMFGLVAGVTAIAALGVVLSRSIVRAAVWLLFALIGVSLLYFLLGAEFLGAAQLIVYVGGTLVLLVFGTMLTSQGPFAGEKVRNIEWILGGTLATGLFLALVTISLNLGEREAPSDRPLPNAGPIGMTFLGMPEQTRPGAVSTYLLPFEIVSIHLLVVLIAAAYLARAKRSSRSVPEARP